MGAIKDLVDLVGKLVDSTKDRKFASELREIQRMITGILSEHAELHEKCIALMTENDSLNKRIPSLEARITELQQEKEKLLNPPQTEPPTEQQISILRLLTRPHRRMYAEDLSKALSIPLPIADYQANLLCKAAYLEAHFPSDIPQYSLTQKGRTFLYERNMLV